jgi:methylmalonyl-CoA mutase
LRCPGFRRLQKIKATRDSAKVEQALAALEQAAANKSGNLLALAIEAARVRATVGEISLALEKVYGRYKPVNRVVSGAYTSAYASADEVTKVLKRVDEFAKAEGTGLGTVMQYVAGIGGYHRSMCLCFSAQAVVLVCWWPRWVKMAMIGGPRLLPRALPTLDMMSTLALSFRFDAPCYRVHFLVRGLILVTCVWLLQTPAEVARQAIDADVHVVGVSSQAAGHKTLVPQLIEELKVC